MVAKDLRLQLEAATDNQQIKDILQQLKWALEGQLPEKDFLRFQQIAMYQENAFSPVATEQSIQAAKVRVLQYLADKPVVKLRSNGVCSAISASAICGFIVSSSSAVTFK